MTRQAIAPKTSAGSPPQNPAAPRYSLSISMEHLPEGIGRVFFFLPRMFIVK
jgi:hypothetical protein